MKIYTKTGDDGTTGLIGNFRISKANPRIVAYGAIDEANAALGIVLSQNLDHDIRELLLKIQNNLFLAGSDLSNPDIQDKKNRIVPEMVSYLEEQIDKYEAEVDPLQNFILPGGHPVASGLHLARTISRRAETLLVYLMEKEPINSEAIKYLNRLSDLLFVLSRVTNKRNGIEDVIWKIQKDTL